MDFRTLGQKYTNNASIQDFLTNVASHLATQTSRENPGQVCQSMDKQRQSKEVELFDVRVQTICLCICQVISHMGANGICSILFSNVSRCSGVMGMI